MNLISSTQHIKLFDENSSVEWTFLIDWRERSIVVQRGQTRLVKYTQCQLPPSYEYLTELAAQHHNVRTMR